MCSSIGAVGAVVLPNAAEVDTMVQCAANGDDHEVDVDMEDGRLALAWDAVAVDARRRRWPVVRRPWHLRCNSIGHQVWLTRHVSTTSQRVEINQTQCSVG